jgi:hypothetical protein
VVQLLRTFSSDCVRSLGDCVALPGDSDEWYRWLSSVWAVQRVRRELARWLEVDDAVVLCQRLQQDGMILAGSFVVGALLDAHEQWSVGDLDVYAAGCDRGAQR